MSCEEIASCWCYQSPSHSKLEVNPPFHGYPLHDHLLPAWWRYRAADKVCRSSNLYKTNLGADTPKPFAVAPEIDGDDYTGDTWDIVVEGTEMHPLPCNLNLSFPLISIDTSSMIILCWSKYGYSNDNVQHTMYECRHTSARESVSVCAKV